MTFCGPIDPATITRRVIVVNAFAALNVEHDFDCRRTVNSCDATVRRAPKIKFLILVFKYAMELCKSYRHNKSLASFKRGEAAAPWREQLLEDLEENLQISA